MIRVFKSRATKISRSFLFWILTCFAISISSAMAQEIYVSVQPGNCVNCTFHMYQLEQKKNVNRINVVMEERFAQSTDDIEELFEFSKNKKYHLVFSDSLYNHIADGETLPRIAVIKNGEEIYRTSLLKVDADRIDQMLSKPILSTDKENNPLCVPQLEGAQIKSVTSFNNKIIVGDLFNRWSVLTKKGQGFKSFKLGKDDRISLYQCLYQSEFDKKYPGVEVILSKFRNFKPQAGELINYQGRLFSLITIRDWEKKSETDTVIYMRSLICEWNTNTGKIKNLYRLSQTLNHKIEIGLHNIYTHDEHLFCTYRNPISHQFSLSQISLDEKKKEVEFVENIPIHLTFEYKRKGVDKYSELNLVSIDG